MLATIQNKWLSFHSEFVIYSVDFEEFRHNMAYNLYRNIQIYCKESIFISYYFQVANMIYSPTHL